MKRVLFITSLYYPHVGGIETMVSELTHFYKEQGIESVVLTKKWPTSLDSTDENNGVKIYRVTSARTDEDFLSIINWLKSNEDKIKADVIHVVGVRRPLPLIGLLLARFWNVPLISTVAGGEIPNNGDDNTLDVWNEGEYLMKPVLELSDAVTTVSKALEYDLKKVAPNISKVQTIYAGIDINFIKNIPCTETKKEYIVSLRRLIPSKGIDTLIKAFVEIEHEYPNITLMIAGEGPEEQNLKTLVKDLKIEKRVEFIGTVSLVRVVSLLKGALCTVVPSLSEGGGLVNVEAQAALCPVVASTAGGIPEYVQDNESGLLFEPGNYIKLAEKIRMVVSDQALRDRLIKGGIRHAEKFNWKNLGPEYLELYEEKIKIQQLDTFKPWSELTNKLWLKLTNKMDNVAEILAQYDIFETEHVELIRESGDNQVYLIGTNTKKILRLSKKLPIEDVRFEYEAMQYLSRGGVLVPEWIKTKSGNFYASTKKTAVAVMFNFLEGYHVQIDKDHLPTKQQVYLAGNTLGRLANAGQKFEPSSSRARNIFVELERVLKNEEIFKKDFEGGSAFVEQVKESLEFARGQKVVTGLIHNDYRAGNVFFKNDNEVSGVIDFDWSCVGPNIKDFALGVVEWSFPDGTKEPESELFESFLEGYNSVADNKISKGKDLYSWIKFATLSDTATFFCDRLGSATQKKRITSSYMYNKYLFFSKL